MGYWFGEVVSGANQLVTVGNQLTNTNTELVHKISNNRFTLMHIRRIIWIEIKAGSANYTLTSHNR